MMCQNCDGTGYQPRVDMEGAHCTGYHDWACCACRGSGVVLPDDPDAMADTDRCPPMHRGDDTMIDRFKTTREKIEAMARDAGIEPVDQIWDWTLANFTIAVSSARASKIEREMRAADRQTELGAVKGEP